MNSIQTLYKLMEVSSRDLEIPDAYQRKLNTERVAKIVAGFNERIANEPKVSFRDGHYYVFDGQHTIVARKHMNGNNDLPILCKVYYGMTEQDEALLFAMQTGYSAALTPSAKLRANLRGEDKASGEFYEATEDVGFHVGFERGGGTGRILCINTAFAEFKRVGAEVYKEALTILLEAWGGAPDPSRGDSGHRPLRGAVPRRVRPGAAHLQPPRLRAQVCLRGGQGGKGAAGRKALRQPVLPHLQRQAQAFDPSHEVLREGRPQEKSCGHLHTKTTHRNGGAKHEL